MSILQRNDACTLAVSPETADVLRLQVKIILEDNHHHFEDLLDFSPEAQYGLSVIYREAFAVLDAVGWRRPEDPPASVDVPLAGGLVNRLYLRRYDLGVANIDRLEALDRDGGDIADIRPALDTDRLAAQTLDRLIGAPTPRQPKPDG
jgi:hypothetical protein